MICGNCKGNHARADDVRACYQNAGRPAAEQQRERPGDPGFTNAGQRREESRAELFEQVNLLGDRITAGRYAVRNAPDAANDISFYKVDKPDVGRWAGKTFVKLLLSDEEQRLSVAESIRVLTAIAADPQDAMLLYGREIGSCGHCGRTLTNEQSRARGIGPICARHMGYNDVA